MKISNLAFKLVNGSHRLAAIHRLKAASEWLMLSMALAVIPHRVQAATLTVSNLNDSGPGSLREAIASASRADTISLAATGTISLTSGELLIAKDLKIIGPGWTDLTLSANRQSRVFKINPNVNFTMSGLAICDGLSSNGAPGTPDAPSGGQGADGGAIYSAGSLTLYQCVVSNCAAGAGGSGYLTSDSGTVKATNSVGGLGGRGGGICNAGKLKLISCSLVSNSAGAGGDGGGASDYGAAGGQGGGGGGIYNAGSLSVVDCLFEADSAGNGGPGYSLAYGNFQGGAPGGGGGDGGAICNAGRSAIKVEDSRFERQRRWG
jgi:hypothetical protein